MAPRRRAARHSPTGADAPRSDPPDHRLRRGRFHTTSHQRPPSARHASWRHLAASTVSSTAPRLPSSARPRPSTSPAAPRTTSRRRTARRRRVLATTSSRPNGGVHNYGGAGFYGSRAPQTTCPPRSWTGHDAGRGRLLDRRARTGTSTTSATPPTTARRRPQARVGAPGRRDRRHRRRPGLLARDGERERHSYGDAPFWLGRSTTTSASPIVGVPPPPTAGATGCSTRTAHSTTSATPSSSGRHAGHRPGSRSSGSQRRPTASGYWLGYADGAVRNFGDAVFYGSAVHRHCRARRVVAPGRRPRLLAGGASGRVHNDGDAHLHGGLAHHPPSRSVGSSSPSCRPSPCPSRPSPLPVTGRGTTSAGFQCATSGPPDDADGSPPPRSRSSGSSGGVDNARTPASQSEVAWARGPACGANRPHRTTSTSSELAWPSLELGETGPAGHCATLDATARTCVAYNYGFNGARIAVSATTSEGGRGARSGGSTSRTTPVRPA